MSRHPLRYTSRRVASNSLFMFGSCLVYLATGARVREPAELGCFRFYLLLVGGLVGV